jgi:hypothetical protein
MRFGPVLRGQISIRDFVIGHPGQAPQHIVEVGQGLYLMAPATLQDRVDDRCAVARVGMSDKQPVFRAQLRRADGLLGQVVIDARLSVLHISGQLRSLAQRITDRLRHGGLG